MKHRSKGRRKAAISRPTGGPVFVSPEDQKRMSLDNVSTTMIYTHVLNRGPLGVRSPADIL